MSTDTYCGSCGQPIYDEHQSGDPTFRKPCSVCGSRGRRFNLEAHVSVNVSCAAELSVTTYPEVLLATAADLLRREQFGIATVVAHMACEVATERALVSAFRVRNIGYLEDSVVGFLNGYSLAADRNRKLYVSLTDDDIQTQPFWQAFKESAARRNQVMHKGLIVDRASAQQSIDASNALVQHLAKRASNLD